MNSAAALVSVIMPAYNAAAFIAESIESVRAQTYPQWELIIVDDGSTDATKIIVQQYAVLDQRISYVYQENSRQGRARNNGLAHAKGPYIAFLDADDLWLPEKLAVQISFLLSSKADLVFSDTYVFENGTSDPQREKMNAPPGILTGEAGLEVLLISNWIPILTVLCRRDILVAVGGFTENRLIQNAEDYHLWLKLLMHGYQLCGISQTLAAYRVHTTSVSGAERQVLRQVVEAKLDLVGLYPQWKEKVTASIRRTIYDNLGYIATLPKRDFFSALDRFLQISGKSGLRPLFTVFKQLNARRLALRTTYFVFNYL